MEFFIKKNATLPLLKLQVVKNGRLDYNNFMSLLEQSALFFSMTDVETGVEKIVSRPAGFVEKTNVDPNADPEYYLYYQFQNRDTNRVGRFEGQFMMRSSDGVIILPIREKLYINIQDSFIADDLEYETCYTSEFPCCINGPTSATTISLTLTSVVTPGSVKVEYILTSSETLSENLTFSFTNTLGQISGTGLSIITGVTISAGNNIGYTEVITSSDYFNLDGSSDYSGISITYPLGFNFVEGFNTIFPPQPTPTPSITPTPTPTPTPAPLNDFYYLLLPDGGLTIEFITGATIVLTSTITPGSVIVNYNLSSNETLVSGLTISFTQSLGLLTGGTIDIVTGVTISSGSTSGNTEIILTDYLYTDLNGTSSFSGVSVSPSGTTISSINENTAFVGPTPTPSLSPTSTPSPTPTPSPIPQGELTLYVQTLSGGQLIIFDGITYSGNTTLSINKNQSYNIEAVPQPGYLFVGWNIFGGSFGSTAQTTTVSVSIDLGANLAPSYIVDPNYDALEAQMTASLTDYQNASINDWVKITQSEYNNIFGNVSGVVKIGNNDTQVNTRDTLIGYNTTTFGTIDENTPLEIPLNYYVVGFIAESWNQTGQIQFGYTTTFHTGAPTYMSNSPSVVGGTRSYYVRKRPSGVEGAPATQTLYPVLNFLPPTSPNAVANTYGWQTGDGGTTWTQTNPLFATAKIQILLTNVRTWPL